MTRRHATPAGRLATIAHAGGPLARRRERAARAAIGMPARYPERITAGLRRHQERWLAATAARLWPGDEYTAIVRDTHPERGGEGR
jgi:hypothetical protein